MIQLKIKLLFDSKEFLKCCAIVKASNSFNLKG